MNNNKTFKPKNNLVKKVIFITPRFYPSIGGVERHTYEITKRLIKKGSKVKIVTELDPKIHNINFSDYQSRVQSDTYSIKMKKPVKSSCFDTFEVENIPVVAFRFGNSGIFKKFNIWYQMIKNRKLFKQADIIHCHDVFIWYLPLRFLYPRKKVFVTFHGYESYPISKKAIAIRKISELLTNGNICVGDFIKKWYKTKTKFVIYGAVNIPSVTKLILKPSALFFGRLDEQTGILEYVKGFNLIRKTNPGFKLDVIGEGRFRDRIDPGIKVFPATIGAPSYLSNYRYAFVSRYLSALESIAAKKLTFAIYDNPLKKDYFAMGPLKDFVVLVASPSQLEKKVKYYLSHPKEEKEIVDKAYDWVKNQTWEKITNTYLELWKN